MSTLAPIAGAALTVGGSARVDSAVGGRVEGNAGPFKRAIMSEGLKLLTTDTRLAGHRLVW